MRRLRKTLPLWLLVFTASTSLVGCGEDDTRTEIPQFAAPDLQQGRTTWMRVCRNCHLMGVAGAPAISDYAAWQPRLARSRQGLYRNAINGIPADTGWRMPPRGGNESLTDTDVQRAVDFMIAAVEATQD